MKSIDKAFLKIYKEDALRDQDMQCVYCLNKLTYKSSTIEHMISKKNGGSNSKTNIRASCYRCNTIKNDLNHGEFLNFILEKTKIKNRYLFDQKHLKIYIDRRLNKVLYKSIDNMKANFGIM